MICGRCARRLARQDVLISSARFPSHSSWPISSTSKLSSIAVSDHIETNVSRPHGHPAATSTSAAQPFTAGTLPKPAKGSLTPTSSGPRVPSSVVEGTVLKGINYMKNQQDPIAMADDQYPDWLWRALDKKVKEGADGASDGDLFSKSKKQRQKAAKALRKQQLVNPDLLQPKIPLYEQSIDLYAGDGTTEGSKRAMDERQTLTRAMRDARRAKIKETNFLKTMR